MRRRAAGAFLPVLLALSALLLPAPSIAAAAADGGEKGLLEALAAGGWRPSGEVRRFSPENLYEEIDGEAELFLPYGFRSLSVAILVSSALPGAELRLEAFFHDGGKDAFGIFSQHRYEGQETAPLAEGEAAVSDTSADFFRGGCFVRLRAAPGAIPRAALLDAARAAAKGLPGSSAPPEGAKFLAAAGAVPGTVIYQRRAVAGYESLAPGFEARPPGGTEGKLLLLEGEPRELEKRLAALPGFTAVGAKGSAAREEWRADLPMGTLYLRRRPGGAAGVIARGAPEGVAPILDRLVPPPPSP